MRANAPARSEQTQFPLIQHAATQAAEYWLQHAPASLADWRDSRFDSLPAYLHTEERKAAFDQAYASRIGQAMVEVRHG